ncbi:MAG: class I SAM-dependent methyltransferase [Ignavibacteriales bacterium]|nr:class I SAM-dependent methyltransferase [Ignavibacteriales bacterium]
MRCSVDTLVFRKTNGIPDFVLPERRPLIDRFLEAYRVIRECESWICSDRDAYERLPEADRTDPNRSVWRLRTRSFRLLLEDLQRRYTAKPLRILDAGAGNAWLSLQLSRLGHEPVAVDISTDIGDGLGAPIALYGDAIPFPLIRAEFDFLPFPAKSFDIVVFNASLHYAAHPEATVSDVHKLLRDGGSLYVIDSPEFASRDDGNAMISQLSADFVSKYSVRLPPYGRGFLLSSMSETVNDRYTVTRQNTSFGFRFRLGQTITRFRHGRPSASIPFLVLTKPQPEQRRTSM